MSEICFVCGEDRPNSLEEHHIVPRRYGGSDRKENLVTLCASCHSAIEKLYDDSFYSRLGVETEKTAGVYIEEINNVDEFDDGDYCYIAEWNAFGKVDISEMSSGKYLKINELQAGGSFEMDHSGDFKRPCVRWVILFDEFDAPIEDLGIKQARFTGDLARAMENHVEKNSDSGD